MNEELLKTLQEANKTSGFNYQLPSGDVIQSANPTQSATVSVEGILSGKVASPVPQSILELAKTQLAGRTPTFDANKAVVAPAGITPPATSGGATPAPSTIPTAPTALTSQQVSDYYAKYANVANPPSPTDYLKSIQGGTTTPATPITSTKGLLQTAEITALDKKIEDMSSKLAAGISAGGATDILTGLFEKFGVEKETSLLTAYNAQILDTQTRLRQIPEDLKKTLADVGVSENQLNRLILKETQKPLETLRGLMEQKGAAQEAINQSLKFVGLFSDAQMQDKAAKLEAMKFELTQAQGKYKELKADQKDIVDKAIEDRKNILTLTNTLIMKGADIKTIQSAQNAGSYAEAQQFAQPFLAQQQGIQTAKDVAPGIATQIADMSDKQAHDYIKQRATALNVDFNTLIDAVAGEEKKIKEKKPIVELTPENKRDLAGAGFSTQDINDIEKSVNDNGIRATLKAIDNDTKRAAVADKYNATDILDEIEKETTIEPTKKWWQFWK